LSLAQHSLVYNAFSFGLATFAAATIFFFLGRSQVSRQGNRTNSPHSGYAERSFTINDLREHLFTAL
jgi:hypothetical protein